MLTNALQHFPAILVFVLLRRQHVMRRSAALLLIMLATAPFTAPFAICDVTDHGMGDPLHGRSQLSADPSAVRLVATAANSRRPGLTLQPRHSHASLSVVMVI